MYNSIKSNITKLIFFTILYKYKSKLIKKAKSIKIITKKIKTSIAELQKLYTELVINIRFISKKITIYQNKKRENTSFFREKEKAYLLQKNITTRKPNNKLNFKKLRPYKILKQINEINYKLLLLIYYKKLIYSIFHIFLLEKTN